MAGCSVLIRTRHRVTQGTQPNNEVGDPIIVKRAHWPWSRRERRRFAIIRISDKSPAQMRRMLTKPIYNGYEFVLDPQVPDTGVTLRKSRRFGLNRATLRAVLNAADQQRLDDAYDDAKAPRLDDLLTISWSAARQHFRDQLSGDPAPENVSG
jgi:hypothetical protein